LKRFVWTCVPYSSALLTAWALAFTAPASGADPNAPQASFIDAFLNDETWVVLCSDFERFTAVESKEQLLRLLSIGRLNKSQSDLEAMAARIQSMGPAVRELGLSEGWMLFSLDDFLRRGSAAVVLPLASDGKREEALRMAQNSPPAIAVRDETGHIQPPQRRAVWLDEHGVILAGTQQIIDRYSQLTPSPRPDLIEPVRELMAGGAFIAVAASPDPDARRAMRELWPHLPPPLDELTGTMLADDVRWIGAEVRDKPRPMARLIVELRDEATARRLQSWITRSVASLAEALEHEAPDDALRGQETVDRLAAALRPRREGARVVLDLEPGGDQIGALYALIAPALNAARSAASR
jgi:hypothetical protein